MSSSDATSSDSASSGSPPLSPTLPPFEQLKSALLSKSSKSVMEHCLGLSKLEGVPTLADNMIVICFDTESWTHNHKKLTELGIATFDSRDTWALKDPGNYGEKVLKQVYFYHARIEENSHLLNIKFCVGNPDEQHRNRFGQTRFVNEADTKKMIHSMFQWPIDPSNPALGNCPVVVLGHALSNDFRMLSQTIGVNAAVFDAVVKTIDTQQLCRETGSWHSGNQAGLETLVAQSGFAYRDAHTACNDAAMTLICAVQMVLPSTLKIADIGRSLQDVVDAIEVSSQTKEWYWGIPNYCSRCGSRNHKHSRRDGKRCLVKVWCEHCANSSMESRMRAAKCHCTKHCVTYALKGPEGGDGDEVVGAVTAAGDPTRFKYQAALFPGLGKGSGN